eukprot:gene17551-20898_t
MKRLPGSVPLQNSGVEVRPQVSKKKLPLREALEKGLHEEVPKVVPVVEEAVAALTKPESPKLDATARISRISMSESEIPPGTITRVRGIEVLRIEVDKRTELQVIELKEWLLTLPALREFSADFALAAARIAYLRSFNPGELVCTMENVEECWNVLLTGALDIEHLDEEVPKERPIRFVNKLRQNLIDDNESLASPGMIQTPLMLTYDEQAEYESAMAANREAPMLIDTDDTEMSDAIDEQAQFERAMTAIESGAGSAESAIPAAALRRRASRAKDSERAREASRKSMSASRAQDPEHAHDIDSRRISRPPLGHEVPEQDGDNLSPNGKMVQVSGTILGVGGGVMLTEDTPATAAKPAPGVGKLQKAGKIFMG